VVVAALPATNLDDDGDSDGDGVNDKLEDLAPNGGDGNDDGIDDASQPAVVSIQSYPGTAMLTLASSCALSAVMVTDEQLIAPDAGYAYPFGLIAFRAACSSATFSLFVHTPNEVPSTYRKYGPVPAGGPIAVWYTLPGATFSSVTIGASAATRIDFALTDGGLGDDTAIDGVIVDQGGPGTGAAEIPLFDPYGVLMMTLLMAFAAAWVLAKGRG